MSHAELQAKANQINEKLLKGNDCAEEVAALLRAGVVPPDPLVMSTFGNRQQNVQACPKSLKLMLEARGNPNGEDHMTKSPLIHTACWHGSLEVVRLLMEFKADADALEPRMKTPALNTALAAGNAKVSLELLNRNADVMWTHHDGATPLHVATAWIASAHNSHLRIPPVGEEPRAVIEMMLHNGVDPTQTEGMSKSATRGTGMTPLEAFRRDIKMSPWRDDAQYGAKFDKTAKAVHTVLEQGESAVKYKNQGNKAFGEKRYDDALKLYAQAREVWEAAQIRGHHMAVLWSNEAKCYQKLEDWERCQQACDEGLQHYCTTKIRNKLKDTKGEAVAQAAEVAKGVVKEKPPAPPRKPPSKLKDSFLENAELKYPEDGSAQGKVDKPGPFICGFEDAKEAGFVDGVDGWKDREKKALQALDEELVRDGLMDPELLDDPKTLDLINRLPTGA